MAGPRTWPGQAPFRGDPFGIAVPPRRPRVITLAAASGASFLDRSADGGKTWVEKLIPGSAGGPPWSSLSYVSGSAGWAVLGYVSGSRLLRTTDAGVSWHRVSF